VWWSVHAPTPTVVRLWPRVVPYLRDVLALAITADGTKVRSGTQTPRTALRLSVLRHGVHIDRHRSSTRFGTPSRTFGRDHHEM
jgi:hypothetical protein